MKKLIVCLVAVAVLFGCTAKADSTDVKNECEEITHGNYSDEMKIAYDVDLHEYGADSVERDGDHQDSPYFSRLDYYNMESTDTLTILPKFKTYQQTSEWSCGVASALMVMEYYNMLGDYNEQTLAEFRDNGLTPAGTSLKQAIQIFEGVGGFDLYTTFDMLENGEEFALSDFEAYLKEGTPIMIAWNDWGGHWQVVIGYDNMGTETEQDDVLIVADPYDTTDHNQDGYGTYGAERFYYNWTMYNFFEEEDLNDMLFLIATPSK